MRGLEDFSSWLSKKTWLGVGRSWEEAELGILVNHRMVLLLPWLSIFIWWVRHFCHFFLLVEKKGKTYTCLGDFCIKLWKKPGVVQHVSVMDEQSGWDRSEDYWLSTFRLENSLAQVENEGHFYSENVSRILDSLLEGYDNRLRPGFGGKKLLWC